MSDSPAIVLTREQVEQFHRDGFLALERLMDPEEVAWAREIYDRLFAQRAGREFGDQFDLGGPDTEGEVAVLPQILNPAKYAPELKEGRYRKNALAIAQQLLGEQAVYQGEHAIFKPARYGAATPWHQDEAYWNPAMDYYSISIWIPLQEATIENGCLWFVPGSHHWEIVPHHTIGHDPRVHGLELVGKAVDLVGDAGVDRHQGRGLVTGRQLAQDAGPEQHPVLVEGLLHLGVLDCGIREREPRGLCAHLVVRRVITGLAERDHADSGDDDLL